MVNETQLVELSRDLHELEQKLGDYPELKPLVWRLRARLYAILDGANLV